MLYLFWCSSWQFCYRSNSTTPQLMLLVQGHRCLVCSTSKIQAMKSFRCISQHSPQGSRNHSVWVVGELQHSGILIWYIMSYIIYDILYDLIPYINLLYLGRGLNIAILTSASGWQSASITRSVKDVWRLTVRVGNLLPHPAGYPVTEAPCPDHSGKQSSCNVVYDIMSDI